MAHGLKYTAPMPLTVGARLGTYEVVAPLGAEKGFPE